MVSYFGNISFLSSFFNSVLTYQLCIVVVLGVDIMLSLRFYWEDDLPHWIILILLKIDNDKVLYIYILFRVTFLGVVYMCSFIRSNSLITKWFYFKSSWMLLIILLDHVNMYIIPYIGMVSRWLCYMCHVLWLRLT